MNEKTMVCAAQSDQFDTSTCKKLLDRHVYAVTYWSKTWGDHRMDGKDGILSRPNL